MLAKILIYFFLSLLLLVLLLYLQLLLLLMVLFFCLFTWKGMELGTTSSPPMILPLVCLRNLGSILKLFKMRFLENSLFVKTLLLFWNVVKYFIDLIWDFQHKSTQKWMDFCLSLIANCWQNYNLILKNKKYLH